MSYHYLNIDQTLKALQDDPQGYESFLEQSLKQDPHHALVETFEVAGESAKPLSRLPLLIKDNLCLEGFSTACGSKYLKDHKAQYTATAVQRLLDAGCRIVGRTNMDEFAMGSSTEYSAFGQTLNPWNAQHVPGGSSGGSAAAVAAGWVPAALGSDTGGSVRQPAALCGVIGYKPTYGFLSRFGLVAFASSFDQIGLFTRSIEDIATLMEVMSGQDPQDSTSLPGPKNWDLEEVNFKKLKVGVLPSENLEGLQKEIQQEHDVACEWYESQGATLETVEIPHFDKGLPVYFIVALAEASANLARYDGVRYGQRKADITNLQEMFLQSRTEGFGREVKRRILLGTHVLSTGYYDDYYVRARKIQHLIQEEFAKAFESIDVLLTPTTRQTAFRLGERDQDPVKMYQSDLYTVCANLAGLPALSMPVSLDHQGLPIGLQLIGPFGQDKKMLSIAKMFEQAHPFDHRPHGV